MRPVYMFYNLKLQGRKKNRVITAACTAADVLEKVKRECSTGSYQKCEGMRDTP